MNGRYQMGRKVRERIFITGTLLLDTPAHFGNGDVEGIADIPLLRDPLTTCPLLTGASIAGALRNYTREVERGFGKREDRTNPLMTEELFGLIRQEGEQEFSQLSWLIVDDSIAEDIGIELRDGVSIDKKTRTAEDRKKFDVELLPAGTQFDLSFELLVPGRKSWKAYVETLALALQGLQQGEIRLGQRKRRGYGYCHVERWTVRRYPMDQVQGLLGWLEDDRIGEAVGTDIAQLLLGSSLSVDDRRQWARLNAHFSLDGSLLVRSSGADPSEPDAVHLHNFAREPILPGTSLAGVLRSQAIKIANSIIPTKAREMVDSVFGDQIEAHPRQQPRASRIWIEESPIKSTHELVQSRVMIDRFTGGALPQHLFSEQPLVAGEVTLKIQLRNPQDGEIGLLLLLIKDLWTGFLPLGGESSVGRGRMQGQWAELDYKGQKWRIERSGDSLRIQGDPSILETYVQAIGDWEQEVDDERAL